MNGEVNEDNINGTFLLHTGKRLYPTNMQGLGFKVSNIFISWSIQYMYSGNGFKQISGNALDLWKESLPVGHHGQLGLGELLEVHHDDLLEVSHPVVLEQLHLHLCEHGFQIL